MSRPASYPKDDAEPFHPGLELSRVLSVEFVETSDDDVDQVG